jgi:iron complex outermembrane recepter protein
MIKTRLPGWAFRVATLCASASLFFVNVLTAQAPATGSVSGRILNEATGQYLPNAVVRVPEAGLSVVSGPGGVYRLINVPAGANVVTVNYSGLDTAQAEVRVESGETTQLDFSLTSSIYEGENVVRLGAFVVATEREGNARAIQDQRVSVNMKKVIAADALGSVSEGNVGEFLKQMPGVSMDYVETDVRQVRVRGFHPKYATVLIDGVPVASAGSSNIGTGRAFEFEQLSITGIETVELSKTPTPDQPATVAGVVNLRSRGAFDRSGRRIDYSVYLTANSEYLDWSKTYGHDNKERRKILPNATFSFSDVLMDGRVGVVVGLNRFESMAAQKHIWVRAYNFDADPSNNATEIPRANNYNFQDGPKPTRRENYNIRLDFKATEDLWLWGKIDFNKYDATFINRNLWLNVPGNSATAGVINSPGGPVVAGVDYSLTSQTIRGGTAQMTGDGGASQKFGDTLILIGNAAFKRGSFSVDAQAQYSVAKNFYETLRNGWFWSYTATVPNVDWRWERVGGPRDSTVNFTQLAGPDWRNPANYNFNANSITETRRRGKDQIWSGRLDFRHDKSDFQVPLILKYGLMTNLQVKDVENQNNIPYNHVNPATGAANNSALRPADFIEHRFVPDWGWGGNANGWPVVDRFALAEHFQTNQSQWRRNDVTAMQNLLNNQFDFKERIDSAYVQSIFKLSRLDVAPGLRFERTDSWGRGPLDIGNRAALLAGPAGSMDYVVARYSQRISRGNDYQDVFKYLHTNYRFSDQLVLRASYHDAITRADIANLVPGISQVNEDAQTFRINNPDLKPEYSRNLNVSVEYYLNPVGIISVGWFRSDIKDLQVRIVNQDPFGPEGYNGDPFWAGYIANTPINRDKAHSWGTEIDYHQQLSFLPGYFSGLSVFGNYTRINFDRPNNFFGSPDTIWNAGVGYRLKAFSINAKVNHTGKKRFAVNANGWDAYDGARTMVDLNVNYNLGRNLTLFLNGRNIFNEPLWSYTTRQDVWNRWAKFGSLWELGVRGSF